MYRDSKVLLGVGIATGAAERDGVVEYYLGERGVIRAYRYRRGDKTADGTAKLIGYAQAYAAGGRAVAWQRGTLIVTERR